MVPRSMSRSPWLRSSVTGDLGRIRVCAGQTIFSVRKVRVVVCCVVLAVDWTVVLGFYKIVLQDLEVIADVREISGYCRIFVFQVNTFHAHCGSMT